MTHASPMSSTAGSTAPLGKPVRRVAVVTHGRAETIGPALTRVEQVARNAGVELLFPEEEVVKHGVPPCEADVTEADIAIVLGGDGTMLRALQRFLGTGVAALGVNFGRVGFLTSIPQDELETKLPRVFAGDIRVIELPTLEVELNGTRWPAVNDVVSASSIVGRMIELSWSIGGEDLGRLPCDGVICASPPGSTAYNLSNGGPVLVWGLDAMAVNFIAPHSLHARPLVVPRGLDLRLANETPDVPVTVLADGHALGKIPPAGGATVRIGVERSRLATLPESTFFRRYREIFAA
jgi:NAD+ kinase